MKPFILIIFLFLFVDLAFSQLTADKKGRFDEIINNSQDNITINPNTSVIIPYLTEGVVKSSASGILSSSDVNLTSEVTGVLPIANGGTGSVTQNFVDLTTAQSIEGIKTFTDEPVFSSGIDVDGTSNFSDLTTFNGQYVAISTTNGNRPCPVMTEAQRDAITSPSSGDCVVSSDENKVNFYLDSEWTLIGGGGGGGGSGLNIVPDFSFEREELLPTVTAGSTNTYPTYTVDDSLYSEFNEKYFQASWAGLSSADLYVRDTFARTGLENQSGLFSIRITTEVEDLKLCVRIDDPDWSETCEEYLETNVISDGKPHEYKIPIVYGASSVEYEIYNESYTGDAIIQVDLVEFKVGNDLSTINESDTDYISYDPTLVGFGTPANKNFEFSRIGDKLVISGRFDCGTPTAVEAQIPLPNGIQVKSGLPLKAYGAYGKGIATASKGGFVLATGGDSFVNLSRDTTISSTSTNPLDPSNGNTICVSGNPIAFTTAPIPIEGWSTGRVNAFYQRRDFPVVEAAGNGGETITANVTNIPFTEVKDDFGLWDGDSFTADRDGYYYISGNARFVGAGSYVIGVYKNGVEDKRIGRNTSDITGVKFEGTVFAAEGNTLSIRTNIDGTLSNNVKFHHLHIQYFPTFADVIAQLSTEQIKGACFNTTYSETEIECGMRNGEMVYRRCFTVASDITSTSTITTWGTNLKILNSILDNADRYIIESHTAQASSNNTSVIRYVKSTGVVEAAIDGTYEVRKDTTYCLDYTK